MRTITVKDAIWRIANKLADSKPQFVRWPEIEIVQALDDGQKALCKYLPRVGGRVDVIRLKPGTRQDLGLVKAASLMPADGQNPRDLFGLQLVDVIRNMGRNGETPGMPIRVVDRQALDGFDWHNDARAYVKQFVYDPQMPLSFYVWPAVTPDVQVWVELMWNVAPTPITPGGAMGSERYLFNGANQELLSVDDIYIDDLVNYAASRLFMKDAKHTQNMARAQMHAQMFLGSLNAMVAAATGHNPNLKTLPFAPESEAASS
jgi:hypothetical protein